MISIKTAIYNAMDELGLDHRTDLPLFTRWATEAEREIDSYYQFCKKRKVITIEGCCAALPKDAKSVQCAILGDLGEDCADIFSSVCASVALDSTILNSSSTNDTFLIVDVGEGYTQINGSIPHVVQDNKIILTQNYDGQKLTVQYIGYSTDSEGFLKINENHLLAISEYIQWKYWRRKRNISSLEYGKMNVAREEWHREARNSRAKDNKPTDSERREMATMLSDPYIGWGLDLGGNYDY